MAEQIRWGILGSASIAGKVCCAIKEAKNATCVAVASREKAKAEAFVEAHCAGATAYGSYEDLLKDDSVQVVYIPLPTGVRCEWVLKAAAKKKHVLCEKPIAPNARDTVRMLDACKAAGVQFMDNTMFMHGERLEAVGKVLQDKELFGAARHVTSTFSLPLGLEEDWEKNNIRLKRALEPLGCLGDLGWYCARISLFAFGYEDPEAVSCRFLEETSEGVPTTLAAILKFSGGRTATFDCSFKLAWRNTVDIVSEKASLRIEDFVVPAKPDVCSFTVTQGSCGEKALTFPSTVLKTEEFKGIPDHAAVVEKMSAIVASGGEAEEFWPKVAKQTQLLLGALVSSARQSGDWVAPREPTVKGKGKGKSKNGAEQEEVVKKKAKFAEVASATPGSRGLNLEVKVVSVEKVPDSNPPMCSAVVGDKSAVATLMVKGEEQVSLMQEGASLVLRNATVKMVKGFIRLQVDKWGKLEQRSEPCDFDVPNQEKDMSATEYELAVVE